jgi:hypothetical protein
MPQLPAAPIFAESDRPGPSQGSIGRTSIEDAHGSAERTDLAAKPIRAAMILEASEILSIGAAAMGLVYLSFLNSVNNSIAWALRLVAWALLATVILAAP